MEDTRCWTCSHKLYGIYGRLCEHCKTRICEFCQHDGCCHNCHVSKLTTRVEMAHPLEETSCHAMRPAFLEPCPNCASTAGTVTHVEAGIARTCNGCSDSVCRTCHFGARYFCPIRAPRGLPPPKGLERSQAMGVQSSKPEEKPKNK